MPDEQTALDESATRLFYRSFFDLRVNLSRFLNLGEGFRVQNRVKLY